MSSRLQLRQHGLLLHLLLLLLHGRHLLRRRLGRRLRGRRWLRKMRLVKAMYILLLLLLCDRSGHIYPTTTRLVIHAAIWLRRPGWSRCRRGRYHRHGGLRHGRNQAGNVVQLAYLLLLLPVGTTRWRPVSPRVQMGRVCRMHRWHVTDGRRDGTHTVMGATIYAATARSLLLLDGRHRWPLLLLLLVRMLLVLRRHR